MPNPADRLIPEQGGGGTHLVEVLWPGGRVRIRCWPDGNLVRVDVVEGPEGMAAALDSRVAPPGHPDVLYCPYTGSAAWGEQTVWAAVARVASLWRAAGMAGGRLRVEETYPDRGTPIFTGWDAPPDMIF